MPDGIHSNQLTRWRRAGLVAIATLVSGALVAGCGGSSPTPSTAVSPSTAESRTAPGGGSGRPRPPGPSAHRSGALAFAECMRSSGVPNFPDPNPRGGFDLGAGIDPMSPAFKAAQTICRKLLPGGGLLRSGAPASAQTMAKLLRIAVCMRQHGVQQFPDPTPSMPSNPAGYQVITDFDGAFLLFPTTIDLQAPAYRQALTACGAPPLGLPH